MAYDAFGRGDVHRLVATFDDEVEWRPAECHPYAPDGGPWVGAGAITANLFVRVGEDWEDFSAVPLAVHEAGETVVVEGRYHGTYRESGRRLDAQFCHVWTLREGKVQVFQQYVDTAQLRRFANR